MSRAENTTRVTSWRSATCSSCSSVPSAGTRRDARRLTTLSVGESEPITLSRYSGCAASLPTSVWPISPVPTSSAFSTPITRPATDRIANLVTVTSTMTLTPNSKISAKSSRPHRRVPRIDPQDQGTDHGRVEQPGKVVDGRVADALDVAVVQAVELEQHHHQGNCDDTPEDPVPDCRQARNDERDDQREHHRERVSRGQQPPQRRVPAQAPGSRRQAWVLSPKPIGRADGQRCPHASPSHDR